MLNCNLLIYYRILEVTVTLFNGWISAWSRSFFWHSLLLSRTWAVKTLPRLGFLLRYLIASPVFWRCWSFWSIGRFDNRLYWTSFLNFYFYLFNLSILTHVISTLILYFFTRYFLRHVPLLVYHTICTPKLVAEFIWRKWLFPLKFLRLLLPVLTTFNRFILTWNIEILRDHMWATHTRSLTQHRIHLRNVLSVGSRSVHGRSFIELNCG